MENLIKEIREQQGISRKELSEKSGLHYNKIGDYENGYVNTENITVGNLYRIAQALNCSIDELIV